MKLDSVQVLGARLLCREIATEEVRPGQKIILLDNDRRSITANQAEIIAAGPGDVDEDGHPRPADPRLQPGSWVLHRPWARSPVNDEVFMLKEEDVIAILTVE